MHAQVIECCDPGKKYHTQIENLDGGDKNTFVI